MSCPRADQDWSRVMVEGFFGHFLPKVRPISIFFDCHNLWHARRISFGIACDQQWPWELLHEDASVQVRSHLWSGDVAKVGWKKWHLVFEAPANFPFLRVVPGRTWKTRWCSVLVDFTCKVWHDESWEGELQVRNAVNFDKGAGNEAGKQSLKYRKHKVFYIYNVVLVVDIAFKIPAYSFQSEI